MIKFWSYKRELNRYKGKLNSQINKFMENKNYKLVNWIHDDLVYVPNN